MVVATAVALASNMINYGAFAAFMSGGLGVHGTGRLSL